MENRRQDMAQQGMEREEEEAKKGTKGIKKRKNR